MILRQKEAQKILQEVALQTEGNLVFNIETIVTTALNSVFGEEVSFNVLFENKRGRTECTLQFKDKDGNLNDPVAANGGGAIDVASFALRCAFWSLKKSRNVLILDEPFKFLSRELIPKAAETVKLLSEKLDLQILMVTHIPELIDCADAVFSVRLKNGKSIVERK